MDLLAADSLPESLIGSLEEEQQQLVFEAARHERIATLATVLEQPEQDVLTAIANHAGLDIASDLRADDSSLRLLPARLVHEYQILPIALGEPAPATEDEDEPVEPGADTPLHLATAWLPDDVMSDWIHTFTPRPVVWHLAVAERVHQLIVEHFGVGAASLDDGDDDYLSPEAAEADADDRGLAGQTALAEGHQTVEVEPLDAFDPVRREKHPVVRAEQPALVDGDQVNPLTTRLVAIFNLGCANAHIVVVVRAPERMHAVRTQGHTVGGVLSLIHI